MSALRSAPGRDGGIAEFLSARARRASDSRLAVDAGAGLVGLLAALYWRPPGWIALASTAVGLGAFGTWGIADRELRERQSAGQRSFTAMLRLARVVAAAAGAMAVFVFLFALVGVALGRWIS